MCSPSALIRVNYQVMRYLHFRNARGDLLEGHVYDKRLRGYAFRCQFPLFSRTKSRFMCFFCLRDPHFRAFRAQNRGFCAFFAFGTPNFGHFEHKIEVFVRFWPSEPSFSGVSSTKSRFLCHNGRFFRDFGRFEHKIGVFVLEDVCCELCLDICL